MPTGSGADARAPNGGVSPRRLPTLVRVSSIPAVEDVLDPDEPVYDLPAVAELLRSGHQGASGTREGHLVAVRRNGIPVVPQVFLGWGDPGRAQVVRRCPD